MVKLLNNLKNSDACKLALILPKKGVTELKNQGIEQPCSPEKRRNHSLSIDHFIRHGQTDKNLNLDMLCYDKKYKYCFFKNHLQNES